VRLPCEAAKVVLAIQPPFKVCVVSIVKMLKHFGGALNKDQEGIGRILEDLCLPDPLIFMTSVTIAQRCG
jgi:hypothetical protein